MSFILPTLSRDFRQIPDPLQREGQISHTYWQEITSGVVAPVQQFQTATITITAAVANTVLVVSGVQAISGTPWSVSYNTGSAPTLASVAAGLANAIQTDLAFGGLFRATSAAAVITLTSNIPGSSGNHSIAISASGTVAVTPVPVLADVLPGSLVYSTNAQASRPNVLSVPSGLTAFTGLTVRGFLADTDAYLADDYVKSYGNYEPLKVLRTGVIALRPVSTINPGDAINLDCTAGQRGRPTSAAAAGNIIASTTIPGFSIRLLDKPVLAGNLGWFRVFFN